MKTSTAAVITCNVLRSSSEELQEELIFLPEGGNETTLLAYLAENCGGRAGRPFSSHLEAMRHLAVEAATLLREHWNSRPGVTPFPDDVPIMVPTLDDVPAGLPPGVPLFFALSDPPRGDQLAALRNYAKARYTDSRTLLCAATPALMLAVLRREGLVSVESWTYHGDSSMQ